MFDEPANGSYANGGLVAFGPGGPVEDDSGDDGIDLPRYASTIAPRVVSEGTPWYEIPVNYPGGAFDLAGKGISNAISTADQAAQARRRELIASNPAAREANRRQKLYEQQSNPTQNSGPHPMGDITPTRVLQATYETGKAAVQGGKQGLAAIAPAALSAQKAGSKKTEQIANAVDQATGKPTKEGAPTDPMQVAIDKVHKYYEDPEYEKFMNGQESRLSKQKKEDVWSTLAQIGFSMAASKNPRFLGAIGEAGAAAMPGVEKALHDRRAAESDLAKQRMETRRAEVTSGIGVAQNQAELDQKKAIAKMERDLGIAKMGSEEKIAAGNQAAMRFSASQRQPSAADVMRDNVEQMTQAYVLDPNHARLYNLDPSKFNDPNYMQRQDVQVAYRRLANAGRLDALQGFYKAQGLAHQQGFNPLVPIGGGGPSGGNGAIDFSQYVSGFNGG